MVFDGGVNYAVVVGINKYEQFGRLAHAVDDANRMETLLKAQGYTVKKLLDFEANPKRILEALADVSSLATNGGRRSWGNVVFTFAGHGFREQGENYLALSESHPDDLADRSLSVSAVKRALEESGVRQRVLFIDACRNSSSSRNAQIAGTGFEFDDEPQGTAVFYSTGKGQLAYEDANLKQGVFTHYLAKGLEGAAADDQGAITFDGLRRYVGSKVKNHVYERFGQKQLPYISGERTGDFVLARHEALTDAQGPDAPTSWPSADEPVQAKLPPVPGTIDPNERPAPEMPVQALPTGSGHDGRRYGRRRWRGTTTPRTATPSPTCTTSGTPTSPTSMQRSCA